MPYSPDNLPHWHNSSWQAGGGSPRKTLADARADLAREGVSFTTIARAGHNRFTYTRADGARVFRLNETDVVTVEASGRITLDDGGWQTQTTRKAFREGLEALVGVGFSVYGGKRQLKKREGVGEVFHAMNAQAGDSWTAGTVAFACPFAFHLDEGRVSPVGTAGEVQPDGGLYVVKSAS